jgi:hypothetical protein
MATFTAVAAPSLVTSLTAAHRRRRPAGVRAATALSDNRERHGADEGAKTTKRAAKATTTRRDLFVSGGAASFASLAALAASPPAAFAEFTEDKEYMSSLAGKDYGKSRYNYPDFVQTKSGLQAGTRGPLLSLLTTRVCAPVPPPRLRPAAHLYPSAARCILCTRTCASISQLELFGDVLKPQSLQLNDRWVAPCLPYKDMVQGTGAEFTAGKKAVIDWDGYTLGYAALSPES